MKNINILVWGNSAREHAVSQAIAQSPLLNTLYTTRDFKIPGAEIFSFESKNFKQAAQKASELGINLVIINDEEALCSGAVDIFNKADIAAIGVNKQFSQLEKSKLFCKKFMDKYGINSVPNLSDKSNIFPQVIKINGFCKGNNCTNIIRSNREKFQIIERIQNKEYFTEEYLEGNKISVVTYVCGDNIIHFPPLTTNEKTNITYCPVNLNANQKLKLNVYLCKLEYALKLENANFNGFLTSNLIWTEECWCVINYKITAKSCELISILNHIKGDFLDILLTGALPEYKDGISAALPIFINKSDVNKEIFLPEKENVKKYYQDIKFAGNTMLTSGEQIFVLAENSENPIKALTDYAGRIKIDNKSAICNL